MYLPDTFAAERLCYLADRPFWVRPLSIADFAVIIAWLDDHVPGREERESPPKFSDAESQDLIKSPAGTVLLGWLALRRQGMSYEAAMDLLSTAKPEELNWLGEILFSRRRTLKVSPDGSDISETWCDKGMAQSIAEMGVAGVGDLSLDQLEFLASEGEADSHASPSSRGYAAAMAQYREAIASQNAEEN